MESRSGTILGDFLVQLGVPFTPCYTDSRFESMPFKSLFGLKKLLGEYGVESEGYLFPEDCRREVENLQPPFIARTSLGLVIVTAINADRVEYLTRGVAETMPAAAFEQAWDGMVFCAYPGADAAEPDYKAHRRDILMTKLRDIGIVVGLAALFLYLFIANGLWRHWSTVMLVILDLLGLGLTFMLVQKSLNIKNKAADSVCKVLQEGGCESILQTSASKFFGIFGWSEVGFSYFSISLLALLLFPQYIGCLALCNLCCLPFTFWSIWYQKFRAKVWCTLCVSVQATLWLLFFCYLGGGWSAQMFPIRIEFFVLGACYLTTLLILNRIRPISLRRVNNPSQKTTER